MEKEVSIVHQDEGLLVLYKPSGLATTSPDQSDCLVARAAALDPDAPRLHATSRLDAEVSGLVTFARTKPAADELREARAQGRYHRRYIALTLSLPESMERASEGDWTWPISVDPRDKRKRVAGAGAQEKASRSRYAVHERLAYGAVLHLFPQTGRTHQLRVHALAAGAPLFGDRVYGGPTRATRADGRVVTARRTMLHCAQLTLPNVSAGRAAPPLDLHCAPPRDWVSAYRGLM